MLSRQASFGCISNSGQPRDIHLSQLPGQPAARCSSQDGGNENSVTWPANMPVSKLSSRLTVRVILSGLIDTPWQHRTKGQREGFKRLPKLLEKSAAQASAFIIKVAVELLLDEHCLLPLLLFVIRLDQRSPL